jgi:hypothetical protein
VAKGQVEAEGQNQAKGQQWYVVSVDCVNDGFLYSLTKYSAIFAEVKGYFGIDERDNELELVIVNDGFLRILDQIIFDNQLEVSD